MAMTIQSNIRYLSDAPQLSFQRKLNIHLATSSWSQALPRMPSAYMWGNAFLSTSQPSTPNRVLLPRPPSNPAHSSDVARSISRAQISVPTRSTMRMLCMTTASWLRTLMYINYYRCMPCGQLRCFPPCWLGGKGEAEACGWGSVLQTQRAPEALDCSAAIVGSRVRCWVDLHSRHFTIPPVVYGS